MRFTSFILVMLLSSVCFGHLSADFNRDGTVDFNDFAALANQWLEQDTSIGCDIQKFGGSVTRLGLPYGPLLWFSFDGTLDSIDSRHGVTFERDSIAIDPSGQELAPGTPRFKQFTVCNPSDGLFRKNEWFGLWSLIPRCTAGDYLIASHSAYKHIYYSKDGFNWTQTLDTGDRYRRIGGLDDGTLLLDTDTNPEEVKRSTDLGMTFNDVNLNGSPGFSLSVDARAGCNNVYQADNGTVMIVEYGTAAEPKIYRSADNGANWTTVFTWIGAPKPYLNHHFHCVTKHEKLGWWIAAAGDGENRTIFYSTDDGLTWQQMCSYNGYPFQPCYLLDYRHPTRLAFGSDMNYQIGIIEFDRETETVKSIRPVCFDVDRRDPYVWSLFYHEGVFYGGSTHNPGGPEKHPVILVSNDLENWGTYARINQGNGVIKFAGFAGGRIHCLVDAANDHYSISPAKVSNQKGLLVEPGAFNLLSTPDSSSVEGNGSSWTNLTAGNAGCISVSTDKPWHGSQCLKVYRNDNPEGLEMYMLISTAEVPTVGSTCYTARVWVRSPSNITRIHAYFYSKGQCKQVGTYILASSSPDWQEILIPPYKAVAVDSKISLRIYFNHFADSGDVLEHYVDGAQIQSGTPTRWQIGGTTRAEEKLSFSTKTSNEWTNTFIIFPEAARYFYDNIIGPYYIKSWVVDSTPGSEDHEQLYYMPCERKFYIQRTVDGVAQMPVGTALIVDFHRSQPLFFALRCSSSELKLSVHDGLQFEHLIDVPFAKLCDANVTMYYGDKAGENVLPMAAADDRFYNRVAGDDELRYFFGN